MASGLRHTSTVPANLNEQVKYLERDNSCQYFGDYIRNFSKMKKQDSLSVMTTSTEKKNLNSRNSDSFCIVSSLWKKTRGHEEQHITKTRQDLSVPDGDSNSQSLDGEVGILDAVEPSVIESKSSRKYKRGKQPRRNSEWEILEGLKDGQRFEKIPHKCEGYLMKKRKWPLKGWHKRYFVLDKGILVYAKNPTVITRGKYHGTVDVGLSVISAKPRRGRIDIDAEELIFHLKSKATDTFTYWLDQLKDHRLYRQHVLSFGSSDKKTLKLLDSPYGDKGGFPYSSLSNTILDLAIQFPTCDSPCDNKAMSREGSLTRGLKPPQSPTLHPLVSAWIMEGNPLENIAKELNFVQQNVGELERMVEHLENLQIIEQENMLTEVNSPNVKKDRKKFGLRRKKGSKGSSSDLTTSSPNKSLGEISNHVVPQGNLTQMTSLSTSNSSLLTVSPTLSRPHSFSDSSHLSPIDVRYPQAEGRTREDFIILSKDVHSTLRQILQGLQTERERFKQAIELDAGPSLSTNNSVVTNLRNSLNQVTQQNAELRTRLSSIQKLCDINDIAGLPMMDGVSFKPTSRK